MKVSVITIAYNSEAWIGQTMESVLHQTVNDIDYWIRDGASKDATVKVAESYREAMAAKGINLHVISEPDGGI